MPYSNYKDIEYRVETEQNFQGNRSSGISLGADNCGSNTVGWGHRLFGDDKDAWDRDANTRGRMTYVVKSYATPIAWVLNDGTVYVTSGSFSTTTSRIQNICRRAWAHRRLASVPTAQEVNV